MFHTFCSQWVFDCSMDWQIPKILTSQPYTVYSQRLQIKIKFMKLILWRFYISWEINELLT